MTEYRVTFITGPQSFETIEVEGLLKLKIVCLGIRANKFEIHTIEKMEWKQIGSIGRYALLQLVDKKLESHDDSR